MLKFKLLLIVITISSMMAFGHNKPDYYAVDSYARSIKKAASLELTAKKLTAQFDTDRQKVRAIFVWITDNVGYDIEKVREQQRRNNKTVITANSQAELDAYLKKLPGKMAEKAFTSGKGVCEDYSNLFLYMCQSIGIEASYITGYARSSADKLNKYPDRSNHVWNGVKIDGQWHLLDATWSAGQADIRSGIFTKDFTDGFFLADPVKFILTHFPDDPSWQLVGSPLSLEKFIALPLGYPALHDSKINDYFPKNGVFENVKDEIKLVLITSHPAETLELYINNVFHSGPAESEGNKKVFYVNASKMKRAEITLTRSDKENVIPIIAYLVI